MREEGDREPQQVHGHRAQPDEEAGAPRARHAMRGDERVHGPGRRGEGERQEDAEAEHGGDDDGDADVPPDPRQAGAITEPLDRDMLGRLAGVVREVTDSLAAYDHTRALEAAEGFFWTFCDDYVELVKLRSYGAGDEGATASARAALSLALGVQLRLFAPFLPFVTEEVWSWWQDGSVHVAPWPDAERDVLGALDRHDRAGAEADGAEADGADAVLETAAWVLGAIRKEKTALRRSMRAGVAEVVVTAPAGQLAAVERARRDLTDAGGVETGGLVLVEGDPPLVTVTLADT